MGETSRRQNRGHLLRERVSSNCDNETGFTSSWVSDYHHLTPRSHARWTITSCHLLLPPASHCSLHFHFPLKKKPNKISRPDLLLLLLRVQNSSQQLYAGGEREGEISRGSFQKLIERISLLASALARACLLRSRTKRQTLTGRRVDRGDPVLCRVKE